MNSGPRAGEQETPVIDAEDVHFRYGSADALRGVTIRAWRGEVLGMLGHNGAGKTTAIRVLNGVLRPSAGSVRVFGDDPVAAGDRVRRRTGVVLEHSGADERQVARAHLSFFAQVYRMGEERADRRIGEMLELFGLDERADDRIGAYSRGMRQRLALARALLHEPDLLYLDEPTAGLDPAATRQLRSLIGRISEQGQTIVLSTHNLAEAEQLCSTVVVLRHGRLIASDTPARLARQWSRDMSVRFEVTSHDVDTACGLLASAPGVVDVSTDAHWVTCRARDREIIPDLVERQVRAGVRVYRVEPEEPDLETAYLGLHEQEVREG